MGQERAQPVLTSSLEPQHPSMPERSSLSDYCRFKWTSCLLQQKEFQPSQCTWSEKQAYVWTELKGYPGNTCYSLGIWTLLWMTLLDAFLISGPFAQLALLVWSFSLLPCRPFQSTAIPPKSPFPLPNVSPFLFLLLLICFIGFGYRRAYNLWHHHTHTRAAFWLKAPTLF